MIVSNASHSTIAKSSAPPIPASSLMPFAATLAAPLLRDLLPLGGFLPVFRPGRLLLGLGLGSRFGRRLCVHGERRSLRVHAHRDPAPARYLHRPSYLPA